MCCCYYDGGVAATGFLGCDYFFNEINLSIVRS